jgi:putative dimethyl sulfoxide reductase chaperone
MTSTLAKPTDPERAVELPDPRLLDVLAALYLRRPTAATLAAAAGADLAVRGDRLEDVVDDYHDLFLVPVSGRYVPPFESAHRDHVLGGRSSREVTAAYGAANFDVAELVFDEGWGRRPVCDHVGCELAFVAALQAQAARAEPPIAAELAATAAGFWRTHPAAWLRSFGDTVAERATTRLYRFAGARTSALAA